jgi:hypothetical protein
MLPGAVLDDRGVDPVPMQQLSEHEPRRACADDGDLRTERGHGEILVDERRMGVIGGEEWS